MVLVHDVLDFLWQVAPEEGKESWDNVGLLVGRGSAPVTKILVTLDITLPVITEAEKMGAELIVSHHPVIWDAHKFVTDQVVQQERVMTLLEHKIAAICMHTNLDETADGVDDTLVETLGLKAQCHLADGKVGHVSELSEPMELKDFLRLVKERLHANGLRYLDAGKPVRRVATGCGACGEYLREAAEAGCDTFLTSDIKYNVFHDARDYGLNLIDAGHFATENPIVNKLAGKLQKEFSALTVEISRIMAQPDQYYVG